MATRQRPKPNKQILAKARQVEAFAEQHAKQAADWLELHHALFGVRGKASELFATEAERAAFCRTAEYKRIQVLFDRLPSPPVMGLVEVNSSPNGVARAD
jgi:hypothetical protein